MPKQGLVSKILPFFVDISAVPYAVDHNSAFLVEDLIDNAVRSLPESIQTGKLAFERMKLSVLDVHCKPIVRLMILWAVPYRSLEVL